MNITDSEFNRAVRFMKDHFGIELGEKRTLVVSRLENYLTQAGYKSFGSFLDRVEASPAGPEAQTMINYLTTNHTFFMREPVHFNFLKETVLPWIRELERNTHDIRIWSAAASTGEEAYSIVMVLLDFFALEAGAWDKHVLATDISQRALSRARDGVYPPQAVDNLPQAWVHRYFEKLPDGNYKVRSILGDEVIFRTFNLMDVPPFRKKFHLIFLRNVMIYFDEDTKAKLVNKMYDWLLPGGYLFIGTTESIDKSAMRFEYVAPSIYRKPLN